MKPFENPVKNSNNKNIPSLRLLGDLGSWDGNFHQQLQATEGFLSWPFYKTQILGKMVGATRAVYHQDVWIFQYGCVSWMHVMWFFVILSAVHGIAYYEITQHIFTCFPTISANHIQDFRNSTDIPSYLMLICWKPATSTNNPFLRRKTKNTPSLLRTSSGHDDAYGFMDCRVRSVNISVRCDDV